MTGRACVQKQEHDLRSRGCHLRECKAHFRHGHADRPWGLLGENSPLSHHENDKQGPDHVSKIANAPVLHKLPPGGFAIEHLQTCNATSHYRMQRWLQMLPALLAISDSLRQNLCISSCKPEPGPCEASRYSSKCKSAGCGQNHSVQSGGSQGQLQCSRLLRLMTH